MNNLLSPDKNNLILKNYHKSSKFLLPGLFASYLSNHYEIKNIDKLIHGFNVVNVGFHSYVSCSCIVTDYIKPKTISNIFRGTNLVSHSIACIGYLYYLKKNS